MSRFPAARGLIGTILGNDPVSSGLIEMRFRLEGGAADGPLFLPGQFAMLNLPGADAWTFGRPLSILDWAGDEVRFLYRVVGRGTREMAGLEPGRRMTFLGPLGRPFPEPVSGLRPILLAGGVGLPPVWSWLKRHGAETGAAPPLACFGARNVEDVPWGLVDRRWSVAVEDTPAAGDDRARRGLVTDLVVAGSGDELRAGSCYVMACGPWPMLRAVREMAAAHRWPCWLSLEEHMGCGYGVCKGCVVPVRESAADAGWRPATCCQEGPVFAAEDLAWDAMTPEASP